MLSHKVKFKILFSILIFTLCFVSISAEAYYVYLTKNGTSKTEYDGRIKDEGSGKLHLNGGWVNYVFDVSEWYPWITTSDIRVGVYHSDADKNEAVKGHVWATMQVKKKNQDTYDDLDDLTDDDDTPSTEYDYFSKGSYVESKDGAYIVTIRIYAKDGITDHAEATIHDVGLRLPLDYAQYNMMQIVGSPKIVDFGTIDLGSTNISQNVTIENIGNGSDTKSWNVNSPSWINSKNGSVAPGNTGTIQLKINPNNLGSGNIKDLGGKLVPVSSTGLDASKNGLKGDFYHVPDANLNNLDTALSHSNKKFVFSDIFSNIQFNKGTPTDAYTENEAFKSGTVTTTLRRDFVAVFTGFIKVNNSGSHRFFVTSDDGFRLKVDGIEVAKYLYGRGTATTEGTKDLSPGYHSIELTYFQGSGGKSLTLEWQQPSGSREIVSSGVLSNGLNILVKATPKKPSVTITNEKGSNNRVNVAVGRSAKFTAEGTNGSTGVDITGFLWQKVVDNQEAGDTYEKTTQGEKNYTFSDVGDHKVYCRSVDEKGVESNNDSVRIVAWNPPTVNDSPPQQAIDNGNVSWYGGKYVGVVNQNVYLKADGQLGSNNPTGESIQKYIWDFNNNWGTIEKTQQPANQRVSNKWTTPAGGNIKCKAVNNYGIESDEKLFGLKIYDALAVNADGPYNGRPNKEVELIGTINTTSYAGASFVYQWYVKESNAFVAITTGANGRAKHIWTEEGEHEVKFEATVATSEGLVLNGSSTAFVKVEAGLPTAMPDGPYRCGIFGGNFTPVQVEGNPPDFVEADDVGLIQDWIWIFDHGSDADSGGKFKTLLAENVDTVANTLNSGNGTASKTAGNVNSGIESLKVTPNQSYRTNMPGWNYNVVENPTGTNEFRYITFAWRKDGGTGIMIQLYGNSSWNHRYHAGANANNYNPSIQVSPDMPTQWEIVTRDLFADWGAFNLRGIAFTAFNGNYGLFDDIYLHKSPFPPIGVARGNWKATQSYDKTGKYTVSLKVQSEFSKWSLTETSEVQVIDGKITGYVRAADLRTPIKDVTLTLKSSHVDVNVLKDIAGADSRLNASNDGEGITATTDNNGFYSFEHVPLGSYRVIATKVDGSIVHEFQESGIKVTELTLDAPNQLAIDFVDLSVFPISGRIAYSIKKNGVDVFVEDVVIEAQAVGSTSNIKSLPSAKSGNATGGNYGLPLFSGQYLFLAERQGHDIRIKTDTPDYSETNGLVTINRARTDIDFIDYTTRQLTVFVVDSGGHKVINKKIEISGNNGQAIDESDESDGKFEVTLPPGKYTVAVQGAQPETEEVDLTSGDQAVTMTIPVKIVLTIDPKPKLFDATADFLELFNLTPDQNPEGYMFYYPPEPRTHTYTIKAMANGYPVEDFELIINDEVSMMLDEPPEDQIIQAQGGEHQYILTAGLPKLDRAFDPPIAAQKRFTVWARKEGYIDSDIAVDLVAVLGDVSVGGAMKIVSVPVVNYTVLHDPPGDGSYSYLDDSMTLKGIVSGMTMSIDQKEVPVYPSPWRDERQIRDFTFAKEPGSGTQSQDLEGRGLLGSDRDTTSAGGAFVIAALIEAGLGMALATPVTGPLAFGIQLIKIPIAVGVLETGASIPGVSGIVQYEVSPNRHLETPSEDGTIDVLGPGKGDIYFGEGWTLGLQTKYRLGLILDSNEQWVLNTSQIETYDILERTNQYIYTIRDIENIINNLEGAIDGATDPDEIAKLTLAKSTWQGLLNKNLAYIWHRDYVSSEEGKTFEDFENDQTLPEATENMIFSAGPKFEYSRKIHEGITTSFSYAMGFKTEASIEGSISAETGFKLFGNGLTAELSLSGSIGADIGPEYSAEWESGKETDQSVGFVLSDNDIGDNISTRVYADPVWGTPLFFQDAGSVTSDPWEPGTNKAVDLSLELLEQPSGKFDYREGAHYKVKVQYAGQRKLETNWTDFVIYSLWTDNQDNMTVKFNGQPGPYEFSLAPGEGASATTFVVSLYPPEKDWANNEDKEYSLVIEVDEVADAYQINRVITLNPKFADLHAPRALITAPYDGERVSPVFFPDTDPFSIKVVSNDSDLDKIQLQIRTKQPNGVWEPWRNLSGMVWKDGDPNPNVEVFERLNRVPPIREFTFKWAENEIKTLGVGEYAIRAVATDKATTPNMDVDPPFVVFLVDDSKPTVLTTIPNYQDRESLRIYHGELSAIFTDDMRSDDFSDRTFEITDLLKGGQKVAGFVSYSPTLRKAIFVPVVPFDPNGFYRVEIKTDTEKDGVIERGVHDLAGNPLDNTFMFTFRTTEAPFEPTWSITLSASDGNSKDANNIAGIEYGTADGEDERDARAVPGLASKLRLSFLDKSKVEYDRDIRPADGRLSYHWFFVVNNAANGSTVTIKWKPTIKLTKAERQYQLIRLVEFNQNGDVIQTIPLDPTAAVSNIDTGQFDDMDAYVYTNNGEASRYFRLDIQKADLVATELIKGSSGWRFLSVPIIPQRDDPFVNLGDDIDPFQLYRYDTKTDGYKIYPLDLGEVSLQTGRGYFTRVDEDAEIDVGGVSNLVDVDILLETVGWYAIGNPFILPVNIADLEFNGQDFNSAVGAGLIEGTLYRWNVDNINPDSYEAVDANGQLDLWDGYWLKTKQANITIKIPTPSGLATALTPLPPSFDPPMAPSAMPLIAGSQFSLRLELLSDFASDMTTTLGTRENAQLLWDAHDQSEPPTLGQTVAVYFDHSDWGSDSGMYNTDYQPILNAGKESIWTFTAFTDKSGADMTLSWEKSIAQVSGDIMLYFRRADGASEWQDMRKVLSVDLKSSSLITKIPFEIKAQKFAMSSIADIHVWAGEKQAILRWMPDNNEFIESYIITRQNGSASEWQDGEGTHYIIPQVNVKPVSEFVDTSISEEEIYTYQISVRFISGTEIKSELFTVKIMPIIKQTVLLPCYPNPFNPEVWIPYELSDQAQVSIQIYNAIGKLVRTIDLGMRDRGRYTSMDKAAYWDGLNEVGEKTSSGVYFYVLKAGKFNATRKMVMIK